MNISEKYELIKEQEIPEIKSKGFYYRHIKTGAEILSIVNDDENKVFGITFRTPPSDSTGLPHILEHSVLCGSRKYPVKEPFVELMKGSLQTFLNAMTYPDKTCYPVASQNIADFYSLVDVYLDAVFYPGLTPFVLQQEGWHYELEKAEGPLTVKGVVFNEMKGAYSSPDSLLNEYSMRSLFPDNSYGLDSGGDPKRIPDLTFEQFVNFHRTFYHPSNSRIFFCGNDDPEKRLVLLEEYLDGFERANVQSEISIQKPFEKPCRIIRSYDAGEDEPGAEKGMFTLNWLLPEVVDTEMNFALYVLEYILLGMAGSPLRRALIESGLGEDLAGVGLETELRQMYFSTGLKGIDLDKADQLQNLIIQCLTNLTIQGIDARDREAALNSLEFMLRENNTGAYPRGLGLMLRSLTTWLHGRDPFDMTAFETPLEGLKTALKQDERYLEKIIQKYFLDNPHRVSLILRPEKGFGARERAAEENRLSTILENMSPEEIDAVEQNAKNLKQAQEKPDSAEALASIPMLKLEDLDKKNRILPIEELKEGDTRIMYHDIFTNGIVYADTGFDLHSLPAQYLPYARLFGKALLEMGTDKEDYISLSQRIGAKTGGIVPVCNTSGIKGSNEGSAWLFMRGKTMLSNINELFDILRDMILNVRLDNRERFKQILVKARAGEERKMMSAGHQVANLRLRSCFREADWAAEQIGGISYLYFLRDLEKIIEDDWPRVLSNLEQVRNILVNRANMIVNVTADKEEWPRVYSGIRGFIEGFPSFEPDKKEWPSRAGNGCEGIIIPSQVNYVAKGGNVYDSGYEFHGSIHVICRFLRATWLWEQVRVRGGAYGVFCSFDRLSGTLAQLSYRDPDILGTVSAFDRTGDILRNINIDEAELVKSIIGTIGAIDSYMLPDAKGYTSMLRRIANETDEERQLMRDQILSANAGDFKRFADVLDSVRDKGLVKIVGPENSIDRVNKERPGWLNVLKGV